MTSYKLYGGDVDLDFDEGKHIYSVAGTKIPSVTGITGIIDKSGPLMWWAVGQCLEYVEERLGITGIGFINTTWQDEVERVQFLHDARRAHLRSSKKASDIGTLAHEWIHKWCSPDEQAPMPRSKILLATVESFLEWADSVSLNPLQSEFKVYSRHHEYAGTCDFDGYIDGPDKRERALIDWKTGKAVYDEYGLQTAAYKVAREEELGALYEARYCVVIPREGGKIIVQRWGPEDDEKHENAFFGCLAVHRNLRA